MYSNNIVNFQESSTIINACTKKSGNLLNAQRTIKDEWNILCSFSIKKNQVQFYAYENCATVPQLSNVLRNTKNSSLDTNNLVIYNKTKIAGICDIIALGY